VRLERLGQLKKYNDIGNRTRDLPACSIVPQPTTLSCALRILVVKSEGNMPLGRPRRRWLDNIRMDLREIG
jgi:hypothetical protein